MDERTETAVPRKLHRRSSERMLGGVSGGLADYTGIDPVFFRIGFIVLTLAGGFGVLLYALGWLLIPQENQQNPIGVMLFERYRGRRWFGLALMAVVSLLFLNWIRLETPDWNILWAIALVTIGFVLLRDEPQERTAVTTAPQESMGAVPLAQPRVRGSRGPRSPLGFMTLGAAFVAVSIASVLMGANVVRLDPGQVVALVVMVIGLGLVVGAWWGRARPLVLVAMLLTPIMVVAAMIDVPVRGEIGGGYFSLGRHTSQTDYSLMAGSMTLDYSKHRFTPGEPTEAHVTFVVGNVGIYVPPGVDVTVMGEVDLGKADLFGQSHEGRNLSFEGETFTREGSTEGELVVHVDGGLGSFDTTWARWVEQEKRYERRQERKQERKERSEQRAEVKKDG